jgi:pseudouridine-5'-phosphate glycosidase
MNYSYLEISPEVAVALDQKRPVVAMESTIIAHGMPYPENVETALRCEMIAREQGAIPATIAIIGGKFKVGLSLGEIEMLGQEGQKIPKTSRRDIAFILASKGNGATTVASTMIAARLAGIPVFSTGGIGGVHRGAAETMDISADLQELARTNVAVVCAGAKAVLNLELTLEYLETHGVPVVGYQTEEFPAFFTRRSGLFLDYHLDTPEELALALRVKWDTGIQGGVVIANPIPRQFAMDQDSVEQAIEQAIHDADAQGIKGKAVTPFLLSRIEQLTGGVSLQANRALAYNNVELAAKIAVAYSGLADIG